MWQKLWNGLFVWVFGLVIFIVMLLGVEFYEVYPHYVQGAFALLILGLVLRGMRRRAWSRRMDCWLEYIRETPLDDADASVDIAILYRFNNWKVTFYGKKATRAQARTMFLPPVADWPQKFPAWVCDKREFLLKSLAYEIQYTGAALYSTLNQVEASPKPPSAEVTELESPASYSWNLERTDPNDYKGRFLTYEESGFRLIIYVEMTGGGEFRWSGSSDAFSTWTEPKDVPIDAPKREELLVRLERWCREHETPIRLTPSRSQEEWLWDEERQGNIVTHRDDGSVMISPPPAKSVRQRSKS